MSVLALARISREPVEVSPAQVSDCLAATAREWSRSGAIIESLVVRDEGTILQARIANDHGLASPISVWAAQYLKERLSR